MSEWLVEGGAVLCSFIDWFLLLAWSLSCERASYLRLFVLSSLELGSSLCGCERETEVEEMGDDALDRDARIKLSIGTKQHGHADGLFHYPIGLVFDHHRSLLLVVDSWNHRVQVLSCDDGDGGGGSFVSKFGKKGDQPGQLVNPYGIAIDRDHDRILVTDYDNHRVQSWSLSDQSFLSCVGHHGSGDLEFYEIGRAHV